MTARLNLLAANNSVPPYTKRYITSGMRNLKCELGLDPALFYDDCIGGNKIDWAKIHPGSNPNVLWGSYVQGVDGYSLLTRIDNEEPVSVWSFPEWALVAYDADPPAPSHKLCGLFGAAYKQLMPKSSSNLMTGAATKYFKRFALVDEIYMSTLRFIRDLPG